MTKNMGTVDKVIRIIVAAVIAVLFLKGIIMGILGVILMTLAGVFVLTSFVSFCPLYTLFGMSTCPTKEK